MEEKPRPYLTAALLCEKVLQEADGTLSVMRIADRVQLQNAPPGIQLAPPPPGVQPPIPIFQLACLVALKSGPLVGDYTLGLTLFSPSGKVQGIPIKQPMKLLGKDQGQNFVINLVMSAEEEGLHWLHVTLGDMELTRIPLMVVQAQQ